MSDDSITEYRSPQEYSMSDIMILLNVSDHAQMFESQLH